jgi:hypothetical protein
MPFYSFDVVVPGESPVAVHNECDMLRYWALLERADEKLSKLPHSPCNRRRGCKPFVYAGIVQRAHGGNC